MSEKDEQAKRALNESHQAEKETASTIAVGRSRRRTNTSGTLGKSISKYLGILLLVVLSIGGIWLVTSTPAQKDTTVTIEQVKEIATLATAKAHLHIIIEEVDYKLFGIDFPVEWDGLKKKLLLVVPGTVVAGVDLQSITSDDLKVNQEMMEIELTLPHATFIQDPAIDMKQVKTSEDNGIFRDDVNLEKSFELAAEAQERMKKEAQDIGLLQTAEQSAEKFIKGFYSNQGYTVNVKFE